MGFLDMFRGFDPMAAMAQPSQPWDEQPPIAVPWQTPWQQQQPQMSGLDLPALLSFMQSQMPQNAFLPDTGFFGNHPKIAAALEGAMLGAQVPSGDTIGENIAGVARTVMGVPMAREQMRVGRGMQRITQPLQLMGMLQEMEGRNTDMQYKRALTDQAYATAERYRNDPQLRDLYETVQTDEEGTAWGLSKRTGQWEKLPGPKFLPKGAGSYKGGFGKSEPERAWIGMEGPPPDDPAERSAYFHRYNSWYIGRQGAIGGTRAGATQQATGGTPETEDRFYADQEDVYKGLLIPSKPGAEQYGKYKEIYPNEKYSSKSVGEHNRTVNDAWGNYRSNGQPGETFEQFLYRWKNRSRVHAPRTPQAQPKSKPMTAEDYLENIK